jgi:hypothetical protein
MPLLFSAHQAIEGLLWLNLPAGGVLPGQAPTLFLGGLILAWLIVAQALWPAWGPLAVWLAEPHGRRRRAMAPFTAIGAGVSAFLLFKILTAERGVTLMEHHVTYTTGMGHVHAVIGLYLAAIGVPMLLSSSRAIAAMGVVMIAGAFFTWYAYAHAFQSVWCFFAALASLLVVAHFWRRERAPVARPAASG